MKKCKVCNSNKLNIIFKGVVDDLFGAKGEYNYYKCEKCEVVNMEEDGNYNIKFEQYTKNYSERKNENTKNIIIKVIRKIMLFVGNESKMSLSDKFLRKFLGYSTGIIALSNREKLGVYLTDINKNKLLDIGCGSGDYLLFMKNIGWDVTGVEVSDHSVNICRKKGINVFHGTIDNFPVENLYDVITLRHVIEHIKNPVDFLLKIKKLLKEDGKLYIVTPNFDSHNSSFYMKNWLGLDVSRHEVVFNKFSIEYLIKSINMKVQHISITDRISRFIIYASDMRAHGLNPYKNLSLRIKIKSYYKYIFNKYTGKEGDEIILIVTK